MVIAWPLSPSRTALRLAIGYTVQNVQRELKLDVLIQITTIEGGCYPRPTARWNFGYSASILFASPLRGW